MLKRLGVAVVVLSVVLASLAGAALAQGRTPPPAGLCPNGGVCDGSGSGGQGMRGFGFAGSMPTLLADALNMTVDELFAAQAAGKTVAEIAAAQGVELAEVVKAVLAPRAELLAQAVTDGRLTQAQADAMLATMTEQITARFESTAGVGGGCGLQGNGQNGTGTNGGRGRSGGMMGGRQSCPRTSGTQTATSL